MTTYSFHGKIVLPPMLSQVQFPQGSHGKNLEGVSDDEGKDLLDEEEDTDSENEEAGGSAWGKDSGLENHLRPPGDGASTVSCSCVAAMSLIVFP